MASPLLFIRAEMYSWPSFALRSPWVWLALHLAVSSAGVNASENLLPINQRSNAAPKALADALPPGTWKQVEDAVDRGLAWIATQQAADGAFHTLPAAQPAVTSLGVMAFLSRGHLPGLGPYGRQTDRAIDFVIACQRNDGLFSYEVPSTVHENKQPSHTASYNHAIAGLMLGEVYGHVSNQRAKEVKLAIEKALQFTRSLHTRSKLTFDKGGWRYLLPNSPDSDLSVTAWHLMFLRSAKNAEFNVPQTDIDNAMAYVQRCWDPNSGAFYYGLNPGGGFAESRGVTGAGILSLSLGGQHQTPMAIKAGNWLLAHPYRQLGETVGAYDRFFYSAYYCSQAAAQLGGRHWQGFYPPLVNVLLGGQSRDGSWPAEFGRGDEVFGNVYTSALAVLALTPPYQLLPIYQR